jgi:hypothetical protein
MKRVAKHIVILFRIGSSGVDFRLVLGAKHFEKYERDQLGDTSWIPVPVGSMGLPTVEDVTAAALRQTFSDLPPWSDARLYPDGVWEDHGAIKISVGVVSPKDV